MEGMLIPDDDRSRQAERLVEELSSELCSTDPDDLDALIEAMLPRIAQAAGADSTTLIIDGAGDDDQPRTYRYTSTPEGTDEEASTQGAGLWEYLEVDSEPVVLERIPADFPSGSVTPELLDYLRRVALQSAAIIPVSIANERACLLALEAREYRTWPRTLVAHLRVCAELITLGLHRRRQAVALRALQNQLERHLPSEHDSSLSRHAGFGRAAASQAVERFHDIVGESRSLRAALRQMQEVAGTRTTVLLRGETGTGKELFARAIHLRSPRRTSAFVVVNCAALPPSLIESELFGHTRGAFTGAVTTRQGRFELAHRGTLFLDEIGDLPLELQTKLLRVLQEGTFERLGSSQPQKVDVRIIAATHRDLRRMIGEGAFREDLYYRLSVFPIRLPPLRERREDIPKLVWHIIQKHERARPQRIKRVPDTVMEDLQRRSWPGNIRELENVIEGALIHSTGEVLTLLDTEGEAETAPAEDPSTLSSVERTHIQEVLRACGWRINGAGNAAERLGLHPNTLRFRMKKLGIVREHSSRAGVHAASA